MKPCLEQLEQRDCPAPLAFVGGTLVYNAPARGGMLVVDQSPTGQLTVAFDGKSASFAPGAVTQILAQGGKGNDALVNNTPIPSVLLGNAGDDFLSGGTGSDTLLGGAGADTVYDIVGPSNYHDGGPGKDKIIASARDTVVPDGRDTVAVFGARPPVQLENGVLYLTGNERSVVTQVGNKLFVDVFSSSAGPARYEFSAKQVKFIAGLGTNNADLFINSTSIDSVFYGIGGNDVLIGGRGDDLFKGGAGDDIVAGGGGGRDLLFGNGGADGLFGGLQFRDAADVVFRGVR